MLDKVIAPQVWRVYNVARAGIWPLVLLCSAGTSNLRILSLIFAFQVKEKMLTGWMGLDSSVYFTREVFGLYQVSN